MNNGEGINYVFDLTLQVFLFEVTGSIPVQSSD